MKTFFLAVVASAIATSAYTQTPNPREMEAALVAAQAAANRPGDEALSCDALQQQLVAAVNDPAVQTMVEKAGLAAQQKQNEIDKMAENSQKAPAKGRLAAQIALGLTATLVPGAAMPGFVAQAAQAEAQKGAASKNVADNVRLGHDMMTILPQLMRGQRLIELAYARKCDWMPAPPQ